MNGMEIFLIGLFCGAYGMFTLMGMVILAKRDRVRMGKNRVLGIGINGYRARDKERRGERRSQ